MKVLVVDDDSELADLIRNILEDEGVEVTVAGDGIQGYAAYLRFAPDLVITDIQMPRGSGFKMMEHIRSHSPWIRAVYMSGNTDAYRLTLAEEKKRYPVTVLKKPFRLQALLKLISDLKQDPIPGGPAGPCDDLLLQSPGGLPLAG